MSFINSTLSLVKMLVAGQPEQEVELSEEAVAKVAEDRASRMRRLSVVLFYILGICVSYETALLAWNLVPSPRVELPGFNQAEIDHIQTPVQDKSLGSIHVFGEEGTEQNEEASVSQSLSSGGVVRSSLKVNITGISASTDGRGAVTLVYGGKEETYGVGDKLGSATVKAIKPNAIVVNNGGRQEEIVFLEDEVSPKTNDNNDYKNDSSNQQKISNEDVKMVRTELLSNPGSLLKYINIKPSMQNGKVIGYELNPGSDSRLFINSGLKSGDIAVEINGRDLTDNAQAMQVMGELQNMTEVSLVVDRNGSRETINLDLK